MKAALAVPAVALALAAAGCGGDDGGSSSSDELIVGIGNQGAAMFADARFSELGVKHARLVAAYDTTKVSFERELADIWLADARKAGVEPFITFGHSRVSPKKLPSVSEFRAAFRSFRKRYPAVRVYGPWNEINHSSQPTDHAPRRAAQYYNVVREECKDCTVLAGDLLDERGMVDYLKQYRRHLRGTPEIWGLHNYSDTNRFQEEGLRTLLANVKGDVWLTETGGIVRFGRGFPEDPNRAARAITHTFKLAREHERVKRIYFYNWTAAARGAGFDSGLMGPDGTPRPGYETLKAALAEES